jgi:hypothetical protein
MTPTPDTEFIVACLKERCGAISTKPTEKPCNGLVAFQDGLTFSGTSISQVLPLFEAGVEAIKARFIFARMVYESQHGKSVIFAEEYVVAPVVANGQNVRTGALALNAQIVLKSLTSKEPSLMDQINGKG